MRKRNYCPLQEAIILRRAGKEGVEQKTKRRKGPNKGTRKRQSKMETLSRDWDHSSIGGGELPPRKKQPR